MEDAKKLNLEEMEEVAGGKASRIIEETISEAITTDKLPVMGLQEETRNLDDKKSEVSGCIW